MKTPLTKQAEQFLWSYFIKSKMGVFGCFEVTVGERYLWSSGSFERVDFMTYDTKGEFRCYEIKVSKSDFNSEAKKSFLGDFNYFVMPEELYNELGGKEYFESSWIYRDIGVILIDNINHVVKKAKRKNVGFDRRANLMESLMKSMFREQNKLYKIEPYWK